MCLEQWGLLLLLDPPWQLESVRFNCQSDQDDLSPVRGSRLQ